MIRALLHMFAAGALLLLLTLLLAAQADTGAGQLALGKKIFALRCAACHGDTGGGLTEARLAFPDDHRRCESCHKVGNPDRQAEMFGSFESMRGRVAVGNAFAIGEAPSLHGAGVRAKFADAKTLANFIRGAMPRQEPGTLTDTESYALTAVVLEFNGLRPTVRIDGSNAVLFKLR